MSNEMISAIEQALLAMRRIYQAGYDCIIECGGECDTPEYMMAGDPTAIELRTLLAKPAARQEPSCIQDLERFESDGEDYVKVADVIDMLGNLKAEQPAPSAKGD